MGKIALVKSVSGIRGIVGSGIDPVLTAAYGAAFGTFLRKGKVVVGRDSRPSGEMIAAATISGLVATGIDVVDIGMVPTPTVEIAIKELKAAGGICVTASHNPGQWNALKFFNDTGEFITPGQYGKLDKIFNQGRFAFKPFDQLGSVRHQAGWVEKHVARTLAAKVVSRARIRRRQFKVAVDAINGAGSTALPLLLERLGVQVVRINCAGDGRFVHEPEPMPKNLTQLARAVRRHKADLGMACDPDADRLALVDEKGLPIGEELTLAMAVKQVLKKRKGATVINLSTSRVTADVAAALGSKVFYAKVGEANVAQMMRSRKAVIGGEGNGGVMYPAFHAGRDALIAAALVLSLIAEEGLTVSQMVGTLPTYYNIKKKAGLPPNFDRALEQFESKAAGVIGRYKIDRRDGLRFDFKEGWLLLRTSNTEPIFRLVVETNNADYTSRLSKQVMRFFR